MSATSTSTTMADMLESLASITQELNPTRDFDILYRAKEVMDEREQTRQDEHDKMQANLKTLAKQLEQAKIAATRPPGAMTATDHSKRMSELEAARHAMMKNITSAEDALSEREATLKALNDEERKLRSTDVAAEHQLDSTTLKLELIRGMGFEPVWTKDGSLSKIIVRSLVSEEIHVVPVDNSMSQDERTDSLWKHAAA